MCAVLCCAVLCCAVICAVLRCAVIRAALCRALICGVILLCDMRGFRVGLVSPEYPGFRHNDNQASACEPALSNPLRNATNQTCAHSQPLQPLQGEYIAVEKLESTYSKASPVEQVRG